MDRATYDAIDAVNWSTLKHLGRSGSHYQQALRVERRDTAALAFGRALHVSVFEPEKFARQYVVWTGGRRAGKAWDAFEAEAAAEGREVLTADEDALCRAITRAVLTNPDAARLVTNGEAEKTITWTDEETGVACKARLDYVNALGLSDLKSTRDASPRGFGREAARYGYHVQMAWYYDGLRAAKEGARPPHLIAVEKEAPHVVQVYRLDDDAYECGRDTYRDLLRKLVACREAGTWGGYAEGVTDLCLPEWVFGNEEAIGDLGLELEEKEDAA